MQPVNTLPLGKEGTSPEFAMMGIWSRSYQERDRVTAGAVMSGVPALGPVRTKLVVGVCAMDKKVRVLMQRLVCVRVPRLR
jgi:hypothetical protein